MTTLTASAGSELWPAQPYLGLRSFDAADSRLYRGRDADVERCSVLLSSSSVRVLVLQGLMGSGKSSFLRAGLLPRLGIPRPEGEHEDLEDILPVGLTVTAGERMTRQVARQVHEFILDASGKAIWPKQAEALKASYPDRAAFAETVEQDIEVLLDFLSELNRRPRFKFLIAIDQVENLWSMPQNLESKVQEDFFALVNRFAQERLNGKLVLTLRTERYGVFASKLPSSTTPAFEYGGVNKLCHHYLANPTRDDLLAFVKCPLMASDIYRFGIEDNLPEAIVDDMCQLVEQEGTELSVFPLLQVVLAHLYIDAKERAAGERVIITRHQYLSLIDSSRDTGSLGLLDGYVRWGLGRAVARGLGKTESAGPPTLDARFEADRWRDVLQQLSGSAFGGGSRSLRKSRADLEDLRRKAECDLAADIMLPLLSSHDVGLLAVGDDAEYTLQHDLLCLPLDTKVGGTVTPSAWLQTVGERRKRIERAEYYSLTDLYGDDPPQRHKLRVAELRFWDHKLLAYAAERKLFARLAFEVELVACEGNVTARELAAKLADSQQTKSVYSFPRELMDEEERRDSTEVVALNLFSGFAVVSNKAANLPWGNNDWTWKDFDECSRALLDLREREALYLAEDQLANSFFAKLLAVAKARLNGRYGHAIDAVMRSVRIDASGAAMVNQVMGESNRPCVAIVTAPTWAIAQMVEGDVGTVIDQRDLLALLNHKPDVPPGLVHELRRGLLVHNVMHIQLPRDHPQPDLDPVLLRLASVGLFVADMVWANDDAVARWIQQRWNDAQQSRVPAVTPPVFLNTFRRSYRYAPSSEYSEVYFGAGWPDNGPTVLYKKLVQTRLDFHQLCAEVTHRAGRDGRSVSPEVRALIERANNHADISNYYDAWRLMKAASDRLIAN